MNVLITTCKQIYHIYMYLSKAWYTPATEAETETVHPSISTSVRTGSHLEVCDISSTEAEVATEEKGTICSFRQASSCASVSIFMMVYTKTYSIKDSSVSVFMVHTRTQ